MKSKSKQARKCATCKKRAAIAGERVCYSCAMLGYQKYKKKQKQEQSSNTAELNKKVASSWNKPSDAWNGWG